MLVIIPKLMTSQSGPATCSTLPSVPLPPGDMLRNMMTSQLQFQTQLTNSGKTHDIKFFGENQFDIRKTIDSPLDHNVMDIEARTRFVKENIIALGCEASELLEWLPWKHWKTYAADPLSVEELIEARYEVVDMFHFLFNLAFCMGMTPDMLYDGFMRKQSENRNRQQRGY